MNKFEIDGLNLLQFSKIQQDWGISHALSTRVGGVSKTPFTSLNVGIHVGDNIENVVKNRTLICNAIGASTERFVAMQQAHTANVITIKSEADFGGFDKWETGQKNVDAIVTNVKNITLFAMAADCAMTLFYDPKKNVLALAHSGWRGSLLDIYSNVLKVMNLEYGTEAKDIFAGISPVISCENYEVGQDLIKRLKLIYGDLNCDGFYKKIGDSYYLDMTGILKYQLSQLGIDNIEIANICTSDNLDMFYSHRKEAGKTGRFGIFAYLK
jgi:polyphenol oxidase